MELPLLVCPSENGATSAPAGTANYAALHHDVESPIDANNNGVFFLNSKIRYDDIADGSSHTIFLGEKVIETNDLGWMSGTRATLRNTGTPINSIFARIERTRGLQQVDPWSVDAPIDPLDNAPDAKTPLSEPTSPPQQPDDSKTPPEDNQSDAPQPLVTAPVAAPGPGPGPTKPLLFVGGFSSQHAGGANFAFGDGNVRYLGETISLQVLQQLGHRSDGKLLGSLEQ